jgi:hypothetical protein
VVDEVLGEYIDLVILELDFALLSLKSENNDD